MIPKDSAILREFISKMGHITNSRNFIKGAIIQANSEENLQLLIDYMNEYPKATYSDVMYYLAKIEGLVIDM